MVLVSYCPKSSPKPLFEPAIRISIQFLSPCTKFELNWLRNKKVTKNLIFDGTSGKIREPKLEMTSYSDNAYDGTIFCCFEKFLAYTGFLPSFVVFRHQMAELTWGGAFLPSPIQYRGSPDPVQNRVKSDPNDFDAQIQICIQKRLFLFPKLCDFQFLF